MTLRIESFGVGTKRAENDGPVEGVEHRATCRKMLSAVACQEFGLSQQREMRILLDAEMASFLFNTAN